MKNYPNNRRIEVSVGIISKGPVLGITSWKYFTRFRDEAPGDPTGQLCQYMTRRQPHFDVTCKRTKKHWKQIVANQCNAF